MFESSIYHWICFALHIVEIFCLIGAVLLIIHNKKMYKKVWTFRGMPDLIDPNHGRQLNEHEKQKRKKYEKTILYKICEAFEKILNLIR